MPQTRIRDLGYSPGSFQPGPKNSILDVEGVQVGQVTLHEGTDVHTGVTVILARGVEQTRLKPCYAAYHDLNGVGEMTGTHFVRELGYTTSPIAFTNTVSIGIVYDAIIRWSLEQAAASGDDDLEAWRRLSIPIVGETLDMLLNDVARSSITKEHVYEALKKAETQKKVLEGNFGGGTAMNCHGHKGGTGTSSRLIPRGDGGFYTLGVLVQANYGAKKDLRIGGVPVGALLDKEDKLVPHKESDGPTIPIGGKPSEGSILVLTITDAPLLPHQLRRIAQRSGIGIAQVGGHGVGRTSSGDIFLALSTGTSPDKLAEASDGSAYLPPLETQGVETVRAETIDSLFYAAAQATEESILNALCMAETLTGFKGRTRKALDTKRVKKMLDEYLVKV